MTKANQIVILVLFLPNRFRDEKKYLGITRSAGKVICGSLISGTSEINRSRALNFLFSWLSRRVLIVFGVPSSILIRNLRSLDLFIGQTLNFSWCGVLSKLEHVILLVYLIDKQN